MPPSGSDGFVLRTLGDSLVIAGGTSRGTLYGVYALLEKLGVRWYTPEVEVVPARARVALAGVGGGAVAGLRLPRVELVRRAAPPRVRRAHALERARTWPECKYGGPLDTGFPFANSLDLLIPPESFREHPDYFPLLHGQRTGGYTQRCFANFAVTVQGIRRVRAWLNERPELTVVNVSQNATDGWCRCPRCSALDDAEGSASASLLSFVNAIATDIANDFPRVHVETLAADFSRNPPATLRPAPNVIIRIPTDGMCCGHPLETCTSTGSRRFRADLAGWTAIAPTVYVQDYSVHPGRYLQPFPNLDAMQANLQLLPPAGGERRVSARQSLARR